MASDLATDLSIAAIKYDGGCWQGQALASPRIDPQYFYYGAIEMLLHSLMRRIGLFPLHGAGVTKKNRALVILGESGAGKSTLAALSLLEGLDPLSDDDTLATLDGKTPGALGAERGTFLARPVLRRLRELGGLKRLGRRKTGVGVKLLLGPGSPRPDPFQPRRARIKKVLFPRSDRASKNLLRRLGRKEALLEFLTQKPNATPYYLRDPESVKRLFDLYEALSRRSECYRIVLGKDPAGLRRNIRKLVRTL